MVASNSGCEDQHVKVMIDVHARLIPQHVMELYVVVCDMVVGGGPSLLSPEIVLLKATPIHYAQPHDSADKDECEGDSTYVAGSGSSINTAFEDEYVPETPIGGVDQFRNCEAVLIAVKNYSIRQNVEYKILESDRLKYQCRCKQFTNGCPWTLRVALCHNLNYWKVYRFGGAYTCLAPTVSQDHAQLDSGLICKVVLTMIKTDSSVSIPVLQSLVHQNYHFKPSYRKVWMTKEKVIAKIYGDWEESYSRIPALLQALQECLQCTIHECVVVSYYNKDMIKGKWSQFDKIFWVFSLCIEAFKHCKLFVSVDETHLYEKYGDVLLIAVAQDGNNKCANQCGRQHLRV
ncbi:uncharacterized protein LOC107479992 [Arachis duranensis]|uniref:Uncharacterized protein LOC107479992 n=1 Tax=Arachis duranensis TaxID=130453 RepID=A0A6P4CRM2_ARADU|nr:uncharacterized protein LOC107479992 [Arachis duranensis]